MHYTIEGIYFWPESLCNIPEFDGVNISAILDVVCNFNFSLLSLALGDVFDIRASMQTKNTRNFFNVHSSASIIEFFWSKVLRWYETLKITTRVNYHMKTRQIIQLWISLELSNPHVLNNSFQVSLINSILINTSHPISKYQH